MNRTTLPITVISVLMLAISGCSLVPKPDPTTTLLLPIEAPPDPRRWPAELSPGRVQATAVLATEQVLVVNGARLMQAPGLRWAATPAALISETLQRWRALGVGSQGSTGNGASLELMLNDFSWHADEAVATVALHGQIRCAGGQVRALPEVSATAGLAGVQEPDQVAEAFAEATTAALADLIQAAAAANCPP